MQLMAKMQLSYKTQKFNVTHAPEGQVRLHVITNCVELSH